jgi:hypothetical protein
MSNELYVVIGAVVVIVLISLIRLAWWMGREMAFLRLESYVIERMCALRAKNDPLGVDLAHNELYNLVMKVTDDPRPRRTRKIKRREGDS